MSQKPVAQKLQIREGQKLLLVNPPAGYEEQLVKHLPRNVEIVKRTSKNAEVISSLHIIQDSAERAARETEESPSS